MNEFNGTSLIAAYASVHGCACSCEKQEIKHGKGTLADAELLDDVKIALNNVIDLRVKARRKTAFENSARVASQALHYATDDIDVSGLKAHLINVLNAIMNDVGLLKFLRVDEDRVRFLERDSVLDDDDSSPAGRDVFVAFPSARPDARAAGNCLAAECNTAAVFHMMRAVEWGLRALCVDLGVTRLRSTNRKTGKVTYKQLAYSDWESILSQAKAVAHRRLSRLVRGSQKQALQEFYLPAFHDIEGFKDAFRNHVMHARREYTRREAVAIVDRVQRFMALIASRVSEA